MPPAPTPRTYQTETQKETEACNIYLLQYDKVSYSVNVNKNPTDSTVCRYLFTAKLLYMFWVSQHPSSGVLKPVPAASGTGHTTCTATPLQRSLIGMQFQSDHVGGE